jgi:hypothetical protein
LAGSFQKAHLSRANREIDEIYGSGLIDEDGKTTSPPSSHQSGAI